MATPAELKILLIDSNSDDVVTIKTLMEQVDAPINFKIAGSLSEGLVRLSSEGADVVLVDLDLPDSQGLEGLDKIVSSATKTKTVVITDNDDFKFGAEAIKAGARDVLVKRQIDKNSLLGSMYSASDIDTLQMFGGKRIGMGPAASGEVWLRTVIEKNADGLIILDKNGIILYANPAAAKMLGKKVSEMPGAFWGHPILAGETTEIDILRGVEILTAELRTVAIDWEAEPATLVSLRDITPRKHLENKLRVMAGTDYLTGADNRRSFMARAQQEFMRARRYGHALSVLMLDIDRFKSINDTHGHQAGNEVLKAFVQKSKSIFRQTDIVGRLGGDEFGVIMVETSTDGARLVANRLRNELAKTSIDCSNDAQDEDISEPYADTSKWELMTKNHGKKIVSITVSGGIATLTKSDSSVDEIINRADAALYKAKRKGRNSIVQSEKG